MVAVVPIPMVNELMGAPDEPDVKEIPDLPLGEGLE